MMHKSFNIFGRFVLLILLGLISNDLKAEILNVEYDGLKYNIDTENREATCIGLSSTSQTGGTLIIPDYIPYGNSSYPVTTIGSYAFRNCPFTSLKIGDSVTTIEHRAFMESPDLTGALVIPGSVKTIGDLAFRYCTGFTSLTIGDSVTTIGEEAFEYCWGVRGTLDLPASVTSIGPAAFNFNRVEITDVRSYNPNPPECANNAFSSPETIRLYVPSGAVELYKNSYPWNQFKSIYDLSSYGNIEVQSITVSPSSSELTPGETLRMTATLYPEDAEASITWISGDPKVATVDETGLVTAVSAGLVIIYARDESGVTGYAIIKVIDNNVISIDVTPEKIILELGETTQLRAQVNPSGVNSPITWSSRDSMIAEVDDQGMVRAVGKGTTFIFARSENGAAGVATVTVIDSNEILSISVTPENLELVMGEESQLEVTVQPSTSSQEISWLSSDSSVAEVSETGLVTALNPGVTVVYAVAESGITGFSTVRVISNEVTSIILDPDNLTLELDETAQLTVILEPATAEASLTWTSTDPTVATVDNQGIVTAREPGFTFIYATGDNGVTGLAIIKVVDPTAEDYDPDHGYGENGAFVSTVRIREGDNLGLFAERPTGYENNDWTYDWYLNGELEAEGKYALVTAGEDSGWQGNVKATVKESYQVDIFNSVGDEVIVGLPEVSVYSRPLTPVELLKKGDGTTYSFIAMSQFTDAELDSLGYYFVFGYTDGGGVNHVISNSTLRYCHTSKDIYDNSQYRFWVYTAWIFPDGATITSGLRYLDGALDENFDRSDFNLSRSSNVNSIGSDYEKAIYTLTGNYVGNDLRRLTPGLYIISERNGNHHTIRKIIKR